MLMFITDFGCIINNFYFIPASRCNPHIACVWGRQRDPSVNPLRSLFSAEFWEH